MIDNDLMLVLTVIILAAVLVWAIATGFQP
jgi:hypothetical protein